MFPLLQEVESQFAQDGEAAGRYPVATAGLVLAEDDIQHSVQAVFDGPVAANGLDEHRGGIWATG